MLDRRDLAPHPPFKRQKLDPSSDELKAMEVDKDQEDSEEQERERRLEERWKYDQDDVPAFGPQGPDEQDRVLVDEYQTKYAVVNFYRFHS